MPPLIGTTRLDGGSRRPGSGILALAALAAWIGASGESLKAAPVSPEGVPHLSAGQGAPPGPAAIVPGIVVVRAATSQPISCDAFGNGCPLTGEALRAWVVDQSTTPPAMLTDTGVPAWTFDGAVPASGTGSPSPVFAYGTPGAKTIVLGGYGPVVSYSLFVNAGSTGGGGGSGGLAAKVASFTASPSNPRIGQTVTFSCLATGTPSPDLSISFGDGSSRSTSTPATYAFSATGTFTASCTATNAFGSASRTAVVSVTGTTQRWAPEVRVLVNGADPCDFTPYCSRASFSARLGDSLTAYVFDRSTGSPISAVAASLTWTFANASPSAGSGQGVVFTYVKPGTFPGDVQVQFVPNNGMASSVLYMTAEIGGSSFQPLTLAVDASPSTGSIGTPIAFSANAGGGSGNYASYDWDFGDQTAGGTGASTTHAYAKPGTYTARCTVHDAGGPVQSASVPVTITTVPLRLLPGVAWTSGIGGAEWRSDVSLFNPSTAGPMTVQVAFLDGTASIDSLADLAGKWKPVSIPARATRSFENVVSSIFGLGKGSYGAILVRADPLLAAQVVANGSTYDVSRGGDGTVGLSLPSVAFPNGASAGLLAAGGVVELIGLRDDATSHTNLAIANLYSDPATVEVTLWGANGARLGQPVSLTLNPFGVRQLTNVLTAPPGGGAGYDKVANPVSTYRARVRVVAGSALFPYASVIDDVSKDPVLVTGGAAPASSYRLPGMVRTEGRAGTLWRSDLVVYNPSASARSVRIAYSWVDGAGFSRSSVASVPFGPGQIIQWVDFVKLWLSIPAGSTDRYVDAFVDVAPDDSNADPLLVVSRVYNNQPSGDVGLGIPGYTAADFASGTGANRRLVMAGLRSDADFRSNVALFLPSAGGGLASGWLKIYAANGTMLTSTAIRLTDTSGFIQFSVDELVAEAGANHGALSVVVEDLVGQDVGGYATVIDNRSGDGTLFPGIPVP